MYVCGNYTKTFTTANSGCPSAHRISAETLMNLVGETLRAVVKYSLEDKETFKKAVCEKLSVQQSDEVKSKKKRLGTVKKRLADLEVLQHKIYEDNALGKLPDKRYAEMSAAYDKEQTEFDELQNIVEQFTDSSERADKFVELVKRYEHFNEITTPMLNELVEKIVVHERDRKGATDTTQAVEIYLTYIGDFLPPEEEIAPAILAAQEAERLKKETTKDRLHRNYLHRKETGKQQEYDQKYAERRKEIRAAHQAALFADGAVLGAVCTSGKSRGASTFGKLTDRNKNI